MNFRLEGSDRLAPDPGLFRARGFATRPGKDSGAGRGASESPFSSLGSAYELRSVPSCSGLDASFSCAAVAACAAASRAWVVLSSGIVAGGKPLASEVLDMSDQIVDASA